VARRAPLRRRASALTGQGDQAAARRAPLCRRASALTGQGDQAAARRAPLCRRAADPGGQDGQAARRRGFEGPPPEGPLTLAARTALRRGAAALAGQDEDGQVAARRAPLCRGAAGPAGEDGQVAARRAPLCRGAAGPAGEDGQVAARRALLCRGAAGPAGEDGQAARRGALPFVWEPPPSPARMARRSGGHLVRPGWPGGATTRYPLPRGPCPRRQGRPGGRPGALISSSLQINK
jgi:hypothetical protein